MRANWRARVKRWTFLACTIQCAYLFLLCLDPFWDLPLAKQPEVIDTTNAADSRGSKQCLSVFGKWVMNQSIKDLSMSPWHCGFSSFDSYLLQLLDSLDPATKFHVKADPCWPFICYDIGDIGFGPITAATAGKMTILMRALSTPSYPQLIRTGMIWNDDVERWPQIQLNSDVMVFSPGQWKHSRISIRYHQCKRFEGERWTVWQGFSISINFLNTSITYSITVNF